jgi:hypothetical protein
MSVLKKINNRGVWGDVDGKAARREEETRVRRGKTVGKILDVVAKGDVEGMEMLLRKESIEGDRQRVGEAPGRKPGKENVEMNDR